MKPDRVVIGADSERARKVMGELYAPFVRTENPILFMDTPLGRAHQVRGQRHAGDAHLAS